MGWLTGWNYRKSHIINAATGAGTNYQKQITVHYGAGSDSDDDVYLNGKCKTDFGDIRFTDNDETTLLDYWLESKVDSDNAIFWVEVADSLESAAQTIYIYYGNAGVSTTSSGADTFLFFDDFTSDTLNPAWTFVQSGQGGDSYSLTNSPDKLRIVGSKQDSHQQLTMMIRDADAGDYVLEVLMTGTWDANYKNSGLVVGDGVGPAAGNRIVAQLMHETSASPHTIVWQEKRVAIVRTAIYPNTRFTEPSFPADVLMQFIKLGTNFYTALRIAGVWYNGASLQAYTSTATKNGIVCNNDDATNTFTCDFDDFRVRKYVSPEPGDGAWGSEETPPTTGKLLVHPGYNGGYRKHRGGYR